MHELTSLQQQVYDYTRQILEQGLPFPSLREIAGHFGFKHTTARFHLKALEKKGYIKQRKFSICLVKRPVVLKPSVKLFTEGTIGVGTDSGYRQSSLVYMSKSGSRIQTSQDTRQKYQDRPC